MRERSELGAAVLFVFALWLSSGERAPPAGLSPIGLVLTASAKKERPFNFCS
jgi:hypothetical protein